MSAFIDLTGKVFNWLTVISRAPNNKWNFAEWNCLCNCGQITIVCAANLKSGNTKSCGCMKNKLTSKRFFKHGMLNTPTYRCWQNIKKRCLNPNDPRYKDWGGRGIIVCERWMHSFENFVTDMGLNPANHSIDRIDNDGPYSPDNCRWATRVEQARNTRMMSNNTSGITGVHRVNNTWIARIGTEGIKIHLGSFDNLDDARNARKKAEFKYWGKGEIQ